MQIERQPVVAIVGRPNVGKSTLFNRLIRERKAIVGDRPGVTVDRLEADCLINEHTATLVDTGGIGEPQHGEMQSAIDAQVDAALEVADVVLFVVDGQAGLTPVDTSIADRLRRQQLPVVLAVNKAENPDTAVEFYSLGMEPCAISAIHGQGIQDLRQQLETVLPAWKPSEDVVQPYASLAVIGRPNVGKSTLINAWLGVDRMVVSPVAGTTRDAIDSEITYKGHRVRLVDTAGQRKQGRINDVIEFVARVKAQQAFKRADAAVMVVDGSREIAEQDMRLMALAHESGCALVVAVNKVDVMTDEAWSYFKERLAFRMRSLDDVKVLRISAAEKKGIRKLLDTAVQAAQLNRAEWGTGELNRWLEHAQQMQPAPSDDGAVVKLKYCTQLFSSPPTLKIFCNRPKGVKKSYVRYLEHHFRNTFKLPGVPVRFIFAATENPYGEKRKRKRD